MTEEMPGYEPVPAMKLRDILDTAVVYAREMLRSWLLLLIFIAIGAFGYYAIYYIIYPPSYNAKLTFMVDDEGQGSNPLSSVLGLIGAGGGGASSPDKILELAKSRNIITSALFNKAKIDNKEDFFANHLIRIMKYQDIWKDKIPEMKDFYFTNGDVEKFSKKENRALLFTFAQIIGNPDEGIKGYMETKFAETSGIMTLAMKTTNEELSINFVRVLFDELEAFYKTKSVEKQYATYKLITTKRDSLYRMINNKEYSSAAFQDASFGVLYAKPMVQGKLLQRDIRTLELLYAETVKNAEVADFALKSKMPYVQPIDLPIAPIKPGRPAITTAIIIGGILGLLLGGMFVFGRRIIRNAYAMP